jgi:uncharacterized membrane protein (DUF485 family)
VFALRYSLFAILSLLSIQGANCELLDRRSLGEGGSTFNFELSFAPMSDAEDRLALLAAARWRLAVLLTTTMTVVYVAFILLIAFNKPLLGRVLVPGLSLGILLGVLVIVVAWAIIVFYVGWANRHYDAAVAAVRSAQQRNR